MTDCADHARKDSLQLALDQWRLWRLQKGKEGQKGMGVSVNEGRDGRKKSKNTKERWIQDRMNNQEI